MKKHLTCNQVASLINFYIEGKLNQTLKEYVDLHISECHSCREKITELKSLLIKYNALKEKHDKNLKLDNKIAANNFQKNLSAYVDNELNSDENIKIKKITISNPEARKELETMYQFKKILQASYQKTKNNYKFDFSKNIIAQISDEDYYSTTYFNKILIVFVTVLALIICGFAYLYF